MGCNPFFCLKKRREIRRSPAFDKPPAGCGRIPCPETGYPVRQPRGSGLLLLGGLLRCLLGRSLLGGLLGSCLLRRSLLGDGLLHGLLRGLLRAFGDFLRRLLGYLLGRSLFGGGF